MFGRLTPIVKYILIINVIIFLVQSLLNLPFSQLFGLRVVFSNEFAPVQFLTYMWLHANFSHLLGNMFAVFVFGPLLEQTFGGKNFLIFYLVCGIGAGILFGGANFTEKYQLKVDTESFMADPTPEKFSIYISEYKSRRFNLQVLAELSDGYYENPNEPDYRSRTINAVSQIFEITTNVPMVGASGAVYGILLAASGARNFPAFGASDAQLGVVLRVPFEPMRLLEIHPTHCTHGATPFPLLGFWRFSQLG